ncbi:MAG: hypothetical protein ACLPKH_13115 [Rhodomicrobium sp.]
MEQIAPDNQPMDEEEKYHNIFWHFVLGDTSLGREDSTISVGEYDENWWRAQSKHAR